MAADALTVLVAYVLGTLPFAQAIGRRFGHDPTVEGSGNPGASNVFRTAGRRAGAAVLLGDLLKGAVAAGLGSVVGGRAVAVSCGLAAVAGHVFPLTRRFQGGKGVATTGGVVVVLFPLQALVAISAWLVVAAITRLASLASIVAVVVLVGCIALTGAPTHELAAVVALGVLVLARHRGNIVRLARGVERPITNTT